MAIVLYTHRNENATLYMRLCPKGHAIQNCLNRIS